MLIQMGMPMPGGWTMSMAWTRMPGRPLLAAAASFLAMWAAMMIPMMAPSVAPVLWRYRQTVGSFAMAGSAYFTPWTIIGLPIYVLGGALTSLEMRMPELARTVPVLTGLVVTVASAVQFTRWKARRLDCCRQLQARASAWAHGLRVGIDCILCCANLTAILLAIGVMDLRAMAVVTIAITAERLAPNSHLIARVTGTTGIAAGLILIARAI